MCGSGEKTERLTVLPGGVRFECSDRAVRELSEGEEREVRSFSGFTEVTYVGLRQTEYARLDEGTTQVSDKVLLRRHCRREKVGETEDRNAA